MTGFSQYLRLAGLPESEVERLGPAIRSWADLHRWLDQDLTSGPTLQPRSQRAPIRSPDLDRSWKRSLWRRFVAGKGSGEPVGAAPEWEKRVSARQRAGLLLSAMSTAIVLRLSYEVLRAQQLPELALWFYVVLNGVMSFVLASNFFKLMLGTWHAMRGPAGNPWHPQHTAREPRSKVKVAIVYPVYHEQVRRVAAGIAATWASVQSRRPDLADRFDVFLLSDSRKLEYWIAEQSAVYALAEAFPSGRFFYRRRPMNLNAKLGNIVDFCRRWGRSYDYMLVMDADSVMDGEAIVALLRMMEGNHRLGILQTNPTPILRESLFGRMQQFAGRLYGTVFSYSLQAMYMGHASYIGHNAMIRVKPFMEYCILPTLPGPAPWGGKPLSHDIVESAMMARAGYEVWFLPEIPGSYEEIPANMVDFLVRERRWMQGNLQHLHFVFVDGLRSMHRETFITGSLAYLSAPLWAFFLAVSVYGILHFVGGSVLAFDSVRTLAGPAIMLAASSSVFLFVPRIIALAIHSSSRRARRFGGKGKLLWSTLLETCFSFLFSPILMMSITHFLWAWLRRKAVRWDSQSRGDEPLPWRTCLKRFGGLSVFGFLALIGMVRAIDSIPDTRSALLTTFSGGAVRPGDLFVWIFPVLAGFAFSVAIARWTSQSFPALRRRSLFVIPEEVDPPQVVQAVGEWEARLAREVPDLADPEAVVDYALGDPGFYMRHRRETRPHPRIAAALIPPILAGARLTPRQLFLALAERSCFDRLHAAHAGAAARA